MNERLLRLDSSNWRRALVVIFTVAFFIRILFILTLQDSLYFSDSTLYTDTAIYIVEHGEFPENYSRAPLYPLFLAGVYTFFGQEIITTRIVQAFLGACVAVAIAIGGRRIGGKIVGAIAGTLWSIYPTGVFIAGIVYPTTVVTILLACGVLYIMSGPNQEKHSAGVVFAGIFFAFAALAKPVALITIGFTTLWLAFWRRGNRPSHAMLFLVGIVIPLAPWTLLNVYARDQLIIIEPRLTLETLVQSLVDSAEGGEGNIPSRIRTEYEKPSRLISRYAREFAYFWELYPRRIRTSLQKERERQHMKDSRLIRDTIFGTTWTSAVSILSVGPVFLFALIGAGAMWREKERRRELSFLCLIILSFAVGYAFFYGKTRYRIPVEPYILILSAYGLKHAADVLIQRARRRDQPSSNIN